jgi:hypothetical protein
MLLILSSCNETIFEVPKPCAEEMEIPLSRVKLTLTTDITSVNAINIFNKSIITCDNIKISRNGLTKSAKIGGYLCKDQKFFIDVLYNDTVDNSSLKIEGGFQSNYISGKILYCENHSNCNYVQIGSLSGSYTNIFGQGFFYSPMFDGAFECNFNHE